MLDPGPHDSFVNVLFKTSGALCAILNSGDCTCTSGVCGIAIHSNVWRRKVEYKKSIFCSFLLRKFKRVLFNTFEGTRMIHFDRVIRLPLNKLQAQSNEMNPARRSPFNDTTADQKYRYKYTAHVLSL